MLGQYWANTQYFNPKRIGNLLSWLDATDPVASGIRPANGSSIPVWADKSGNSNSATQLSGGNQPTYTTGARNGLPVITFNSAAPQYVTGSLTGLAANPNLSIYVVASSTTTAGNPVVFGIGSVNASYHSIGLGINTGDFVGFQWGGYAETFSSADTNYNRLQLNQDNSTNTTSLFVNGASATGSSGVKDALNLNTTFSIGRHSNPLTASWNGTVAEVIIYNKTLSAAENTAVYNYLTQKWGF